MAASADASSPPSLVEQVSAALRPTAQAAHAWGRHVSEEWRTRPYRGAVTDACGFTVGLVDPTWPTCLGLKFRGLCLCVEGDCAACIPNFLRDYYNTPEAVEPFKRCICFDGELFGRKCDEQAKPNEGLGQRRERPCSGAAG